MRGIEKTVEQILGRGLVSLCLLLLYVSIFGVAVAADDSITVRVGIYENQPKIFTDDQGNASGFWPDIIEYIASKEGWKIEYIHGTWTECLKRLENNEIDIMPDVAYTEERNRQYDFSHETVYTSWSMVYTRKGVDIQSILDLEGKNIAVLKGSVNVEGPDGIKNLVSAFNINCTFTEVDSYTRVFELVKSGEADAGVTSKDFGYQHETDFNVVKTAIIFQPSPLYFAFPKNSSLTPYLIERIDHHMKELKQDYDSIYYQSLGKWFGEKHAEKSVIPVWLIWALAGTGGLILLLVGGSLLLRSQVRSRTKELTEEISEHKRAEEKLAKYRQRLEKLVEARTAELAAKTVEIEKANIHLQEMDRLKSVFLASMSHELRTPLNSIIGFTGIMLQGMAGGLNDEQQKQLKIVKSSASHLLNLINDVLDISKIEAGRIELSLEEFKIDDMMQDVVQTFSHMVSEKGLEFVTEVPEIGVLFSDERRVKQVLINLVSNAVKFTDRGTVKIAARVLDGGKLELCVSDTGIGIKEEDMSKLFEPFQQVDVSLRKRHEGTGLGLYLTRKLAELLGGDISAKSQYGQGSEFTFTMPLRYKHKREVGE
jgi:signal transduction histidine kinase